MTSTENHNLENHSSQMRKGILEFCILLIIRTTPGIYAPDILRRLKDIDMIVVEGTIYPLLSRLKRENILEYSWEESMSGPPRKLYALTPKGKDMLGQLVLNWKSLSSSITSLLRHE